LTTSTSGSENTDVRLKGSRKMDKMRAMSRLIMAQSSALLRTLLSAGTGSCRNVQDREG
jgi:hypothetical protein